MKNNFRGLEDGAFHSNWILFYLPNVIDTLCKVELVYTPQRMHLVYDWGYWTIGAIGLLGFWTSQDNEQFGVLQFSGASQFDA